MSFLYFQRFSYGFLGFPSCQPQRNSIWKPSQLQVLKEPILKSTLSKLHQDQISSTTFLNDPKLSKLQESFLPKLNKLEIKKRLFFWFISWWLPWRSVLVINGLMRLWRRYEFIFEHSQNTLVQITFVST